MLDVVLAGPSESATHVDATLTVTALRECAGRLARGAREVDAGGLSCAVGELSSAQLTAFVEGLALGHYRFSLRQRSTNRATGTAQRRQGKVILAGTSDQDAVASGLRTAAAATWARDLTNMPAATKTPAWLGAQAEQVLVPLGVDVVVRDRAWLAAQGFGGVLAVGSGSVSPPRLIQASWRPRGAKPGKHFVVVGKGITFDTGGINLKPGASMRTMQTDMGGGAAALAALMLVAQARLPVRVTVLVPSAENSFSGSAYRPSDVVRHYGGRTSEIGNTDAEGRLVLADALAYAARRLEPTALVDLATLTGAMKIALGLRVAGVFATDDALASSLIAAGESTGESLWRMPLASEYASRLHSEIADANNAPGSPGAITAALFLRPFAGEVPWAHLDIAGPARSPEDDGMFAKGATGFGARLLARWLADDCA